MSMSRMPWRVPMPRLIDAGPDAPATLTLRVGDIVRFNATGGRVLHGGDALENLGAFAPGVVGTHGGVLSPQGVPATQAFRALRAGAAAVELHRGGFGFVATPPHAVAITIED